MDDPVCPVCTLSVRKGISLEEHLNTHPKDQVIQALIRRCLAASTNNTAAASPMQFVPTSNFTPLSLFVHPSGYLHYNPVPTVPAPFVPPSTVFSPTATRPAALSPEVPPSPTLISNNAQVALEKEKSSKLEPGRDATSGHEDEGEESYGSNEEEDDSSAVKDLSHPSRALLKQEAVTPGPSGTISSSCTSNSSSSLMTHAVTRENGTIVDSVFIEVKDDLVQKCQNALSTHSKASGTPMPALVESLMIEQKEQDMVHCPEVLDVHSDRSSDSMPIGNEPCASEGELILGMNNDDYSEHFSLGAHSPKDNASIRDIQTDETMPPQGELSEQESIGGDSASLWGPAAEDVFSGLASQRRSGTPHMLSEWQPMAAAASRHSEMASSSTSNNTNSVHSEHNIVFCGTIVPLVSGADQWRQVDIKPVEIQEPVDPTKVLLTVMGDETLLVEQSVRRQQVCLACNKTFISYRELQNHRRKEHRKTKYKCPICVVPREFSERKDYLEHTKSHPLECPLCGKTFKNLPSLSLHMKREMNIRPHKCQLCDKSFITKQKLMEHSNKHSGLTPYECKICGKGFRRYSNLIQHRDWLHLRKRKPPIDLFCGVCEQIFHSKKRLEWHLEEAHFPQPHVCAHCPQRFTHASCLTRHVRQLHDRKYQPQTKDGVKRGCKECTECGGVYSRTSLVVHMRTHSGLKPFKCTICFKAFTTRWNLNQHMWTHESPAQLPLKCDFLQCRKAFYRKEDLEAHRRSHTKHKAYTCNTCGMKFLRKSNCMRHFREHLKDKEHSCDVCSKTFHRSYYLAEHMRTHSGEKPFSCHICGKCSTTKSNHNKHLKTHLGKEPVTPEN